MSWGYQGEYFSSSTRGKSEKFIIVDGGDRTHDPKNHGPAVDATCKVIGGDTECPLQVYQLGRSSESTHFLCLRRDVALFDSTRAPDSF